MIYEVLRVIQEDNIICQLWFLLEWSETFRTGEDK